jgi:hypothetical protein
LLESLCGSLDAVLELTERLLRYFNRDEAGSLEEGTQITTITWWGDVVARE